MNETMILVFNQFDGEDKDKYHYQHKGQSQRSILL